MQCQYCKTALNVGSLDYVTVSARGAGPYYPYYFCSVAHVGAYYRAPVIKSAPVHTLYIKLQTGREAGDVTITNGLGKFYTFFWGVGEWQEYTEEQRNELLTKWLNALSDNGVVLSIQDTKAIDRAIFLNVL